MLRSWIVDEEGRVKVRQLGRLADPSATQAATKRPLIAEIEDCTVLLPPFVGGLSTNGTLDGESTVANDVADIDEPVNQRRVRLWSNEVNDTNKTAGMRLVRSIDASDSDDEEEQSTWDWYKQRVRRVVHRKDCPCSLKSTSACRRLTDRRHPWRAQIARLVVGGSRRRQPARSGQA